MEWFLLSTRRDSFTCGQCPQNDTIVRASHNIKIYLHTPEHALKHRETGMVPVLFTNLDKV